MRFKLYGSPLGNDENNIPTRIVEVIEISGLEELIHNLDNMKGFYVTINPENGKYIGFRVEYFEEL